MAEIITVEPLTRAAFAPFGDVLDFDTDQHFAINDGTCERYHALAKTEALGEDAHVLINLFRAKPASLPLSLAMVERHPLGSQAFIPLSPQPFLVLVCPNGPDGPARPRAFLTVAGQGVNYRANTWHGVLTPLGAPQDFAVIDRGGMGSNLEEFRFQTPYMIKGD